MATIKTPKHRVPRICVLLNMSLEACREKLRGILRYERLFGPLQIHLPNLDASPLEDIAFYGFDGIIADCVPDLFSQEILQQSRLPIILLDYLSDTEPPFERYGMVRCDGKAIGEMGAEYLSLRGLTHFAFVDDITRSNWSATRRDAFVGKTASYGFDCQIFPASDKPDEKQKGDNLRLVNWLKRLPKPVGIMASNDVRGRQILYACEKAGISVPKEAAVLGVDNDNMICQICEPTLSSIVIDNQTGGFLATQMLLQILQSGKSVTEVSYYNPLYVYERRSAGINHNIEPFVQEAVDFIEINSGIGISVSDVVKHVQVSRRLLETHFKQSLGKTILEEINRVRFIRICILLLETNLSIAEIAQLCGFQSEFYICTAFKKRFGKTIFQYRKDRG